MAILSRLTIHLRPSIILCYVSAGGLLYVLYQNAAQLSTSQLHSSPQRRFLTFESGNSSCPATPPANTTQKFDFQGLYEYLQDIQKNCSKDDPRLVYQYDEAFLTLDAVRRWTGEHWKTWSPCPGNDILKRLLTWKFPLVNLLSQFGKQPLGIWREIATICHLIGDPIDTLASMFYTLHVCWLRVRMLKQLQLEPQDWKAVVLVMQAFDECSGQFAMLELEARIIEALRKNLDLRDIISREELEAYRKTAAALTADRTTKGLPVVVAQAIFGFSFAISYYQTFAAPLGHGNWWNIEIHSIAFSLLVIWAIPAVCFASLIGVSQTRNSMPKILKTHDNLEYIPHDGNGDTNERNWNDDEEPRLHLRAWNGGMPSQRPDRWDRSAMASQSCRAQAARWSWFHGTMAFLVVFSGTLAAWLLSFFVPPDLFLCRQIAQSSAFWFWLPSFAIQYLVAKCVAKWAAGRDKWKKWASWVLLVKDLVCALAVTNVILVTQWGIMNRSICWADKKDPKTPVFLPQSEYVQTMMLQRKGTVFPAIIFGFIALQIVICIVVALVFKGPIRVFLQRDDGQSNMSWLDDLSGWFGRRRERIELQHQILTQHQEGSIPGDDQEGGAYELQAFSENTPSDEWALEIASMLEAGISTHLVSG